MEPTYTALKDLAPVTSARAAEVVGVGYEGFRSYLKRGLLGRVGILPGFHRPGADTQDDRAPRSGWKTFGFADLCLMRLAKLLMDAGFSYATADGVVSRSNLWQSLAHDEQPVDRILMLWPPYGDHIVFEPTDLVHLPARIKEVEDQAVVTLINLGDVQRHVATMLNAPVRRPRRESR